MDAPTAAASAAPAASLLEWYARHRRVLPWRAPPGANADPYRVWLSEIMLQQTTVGAVIPYYARFLARFPDVVALADAAEEDVLAAWAGLGYYARGRNLHRCARHVAAAGGRFPADVASLEALPGIGRYTARAIASIAFGIPTVPADGNVERVVARLHAVTEPLPGSRRRLGALADLWQADPAARAAPSDFTQSLFDLGATICTPRRPACALCPWRPACAGHASGLAETLPRKDAKAARPLRYGVHFWLEDATGQVLLRRRPARGLFAGMAELPGTAWREAAWGVAEALRFAPAAADWRAAGHVRHVLTHLELHLDLFAARVTRLPAATPPDFSRDADLLGGEALSTVMRRCAALGLAALR